MVQQRESDSPTESCVRSPSPIEGPEGELGQQHIEGVAQSTSVLRLAVEWSMLPSAPQMRLLPGEKHRERVFSPDEEARYLAAAPKLLSSVHLTVLSNIDARYVTT
jgi:hypothetical protein